MTNDKRRSEDAAAHLRALERLQGERTLFEPAARQVVAAALAHLDASKGPVVEIGSGGGQLRRWLPAGLLPAMVHTEPEAAFVAKFQRAMPDATVQVAAAESLPFADESVAGVLGLCVLDVVDLARVARELLRVLRPGGSVVQFWDMAPNMRWLCESEIRQGRVLLPNCFSDPLVRAELPRELQAALPPLDFLRDLVSVPASHLAGLIALLRPSPSALIEPAALARLERYLAHFEVPADGAAAAKALAWLGEDEREAHAYKGLLLNAWLMLQQARGGSKLPLELGEISAAQALSDRLAEAFAALGLEVESSVRRARAVVPRPRPAKNAAGERLAQAHFVGRWLGTTAFAAAVPPATADVLSADAAAGPDQLVVEAGVLVLTANRPG
jgi:SAM-dependent methyltransferase